MRKDKKRIYGKGRGKTGVHVSFVPRKGKGKREKKERGGRSDVERKERERRGKEEVEAV